MKIKKIILFLLIFSYIFGSIGTSLAYILPATTVANYMTALNNNISQYDNHVIDLDSVITNLGTISTTNDTIILDNGFMTIYDEIISTKTAKTTDLNNKLTQIEAVKASLNTKYLNGEIQKNDYGILVNKLDGFANSIKLELINLGNIDSYLTSKTNLISLINNKLTDLSTNRTEMITRKTNFSTKLSTYKTSVTDFSTTGESTKLDGINTIGTELDGLVTDNQIYNLLINTNIQDLNSLLKEFTALKTSLQQYQQKLTYLGTLTFDLTVELENITNTVNSKVTQTQLSNQVISTLNTNSISDGETPKTGIDKTLTDTLTNSLISDISKVTNDSTVSGLNLYNISYKIPIDGYLVIDGDITTSTSNQAIMKGVYTSLGTNIINQYGIELPSIANGGKTNVFTQSLPIKKIQKYNQTIGLNINRKEVIQIGVNYTSDLSSRVYKVKTAIDLTKQNLTKSDGTPLTITGTLDLDGIELDPGQYTVNFRLGLDKSQVEQSLSDITDTMLRKKLYISIIDKNQKVIYSESISQSDENVLSLDSISITNRGELKINTSNPTTLTIDYDNFVTGEIYTSYITDIEISFLGYADLAYKTLQDSIVTQYKTKIDNKIIDNLGKTIAYKKTSVNVEINKDLSTRTITYNKLNDIKWNTTTKKFDLIFTTYTLEQNVIIDPIIKTYLKTGIDTPGFDIRFNDIRDGLTISDKVEKYTRLADTQGKDLITEYRYFDSTANNDTALGDTTGKVLIFFRIVETLEEGDKTKGIDRIENVYYKVGLDENYGKVISTNNTVKTITSTGDLADIDKTSFVVINPIMNYKVFTYYTIYFNKSAYLSGDIKSSIRYTKIYEKNMLDYQIIKFNGNIIGEKGSGITFLDTVRN